MNSRTAQELFQEHVTATGKHGLYVSWMPCDGEENTIAELHKAAPYLVQILVWPHDHEAFLVFDTQDAMEEAFWSTVGDDGPTESNPYDGPCRVYAQCYWPSGMIGNSNT